MLGDDHDIGDDEDFGFGEVPATTVQPPTGTLYQGYDPAGTFPAIDNSGGMLPEESGFLFDELGIEPTHVSGLAALAQRPTAELPRSERRPTNNGSIGSTLGSIIALKSRFPKPSMQPTGTLVGAKHSGTAPGSPAGSPTGAQRAGSGAFPAAAAPASLTNQINNNAVAWRQKRRKPTPWTDAENAKFYNALRQFGTNLALIAMLFPGRERTDIVRKFHQEQKRQQHVLFAALDPDNELPIDVEDFASQSHEWARQQLMKAAGPLDESDANILRELESAEHLAQQVRPPQPPAEGPTGTSLAAANTDASASGATDRRSGPAPATARIKPPPPANFSEPEGMQLMSSSDRTGTGFSTIFGEPDDDDLPFVQRPGYEALAAAQQQQQQAPAQQGKGKSSGKSSGKSKRSTRDAVPAPAAAAAPLSSSGKEIDSTLGALQAAELAELAAEFGNDDGFDFDLGDGGADFAMDDM